MRDTRANPPLPPPPAARAKAKRPRRVRRDPRTKTAAINEETASPLASRKCNVKQNAQPHILVADDNAAMQDAVLTILRVAGFDPDGVDNGEAAIEAVKKTDYDLVLMDVDMPKLNGIDATKVIRALPNGKSRVPIVAFSGSVTPDDRKRFFQAGMDGFAAKPIAANELVNLVEKWTHVSPPADKKNAPKAARARTMSDLPLIEPMTLADLEAMIGIELLLELLVMFDETACRHADNIRAAVKGKDLGRLAREAHDLKSIAGNCGLTRLSRHAAGIETAYREGKKAHAFALAREVDALLAESRASLLATYPGIPAKYGAAQASRTACRGN